MLYGVLIQRLPVDLYQGKGVQRTADTRIQVCFSVFALSERNTTTRPRLEAAELRADTRRAVVLLARSHDLMLRISELVVGIESLFTPSRPSIQPQF